MRADLARAADPAHSADAAVFTALLLCHGTIAGLVAAGRLTPRSESEDLAGWWMNLFSYLASGPPGPRLEELLALSEAGVVRFLGADVGVELDEAAGVFRARSPSAPAAPRRAALVEARVPAPDVSATPDPLVTALLAPRRGHRAGAARPDADGGVRRTGRLDVDPAQRVVTATGGAQDAPVRGRLLDRRARRWRRSPGRARTPRSSGRTTRWPATCGPALPGIARRPGSHAAAGAA